MNMIEKNGQPSMEEILASIRRIIAEEPANQSSGGELRGTPILLKGDGVLDDAGDFDLPAIFRSSPSTVESERPAPLLGRLSDAIRSATAAQPETAPYLNGADNGHGDALNGGSRKTDPLAAYPGLSSLKPLRSEVHRSSEALASAHVNGHGPAISEPVPQPAPLQAASGSSSDNEPKRVMAPFKDTHFLRMAGPAAAPGPTVSEPLTAAPPPATPSLSAAPADPAVIADAPEHNVPPPPPAAFAVPEPTVASVVPRVVAMPPPPLPPAVPQAAAAEGVGSIEDTTADLLRPMLRQWLADNMPRMVEKALHIEIAESVKPPKKP